MIETLSLFWNPGGGGGQACKQTSKCLSYRSLHERGRDGGLPNLLKEEEKEEEKKKEGDEEGVEMQWKWKVKEDMQDDLLPLVSFTCSS